MYEYCIRWPSCASLPPLLCHHMAPFNPAGLGVWCGLLDWSRRIWCRTACRRISSLAAHEDAHKVQIHVQYMHTHEHTWAHPVGGFLCYRKCILMSSNLIASCLSSWSQLQNLHSEPPFSKCKETSLKNALEKEQVSSFNLLAAERKSKGQHWNYKVLFFLQWSWNN